MNAMEKMRGNEALRRRLFSAIRQGRFPHACILQGPKGCGKGLLALSLARALQCEQGEGVSCGSCVSCRTIESGNHPDVFWVEPKKTKVLGVEDIREQVVQEVAIKPYRSRYKVFVLPEADQMTVAAQNGFLKTLEEPPAYGVFLLLAEQAASLLPTVRSRCPVYALKPLSQGEVASFLMEEKQVPKEQAAFLGEYAAGTIGKALWLLEDEGFLAMQSDVLEKLCALPKTNTATVLSWAAEWVQYKQNSLFWEVLLLFYRDVLLENQLPQSRFLLEKEKQSQIAALSQALTPGQIRRSLDAVWTAKKQAAQNVNLQMALEEMLLTIKGEQHV